MSKISKKRIQVTTGDITKMKVDAIVNAANSSLMGGGGVDGAIHRAGGPEILSACKEIRESEYPNGLPAGKAVMTTGGRLAASYVIHTVGPVWNGGKSGEKQTLANAYNSSLELAASKGLESIAIPAISTGIYGYPKSEAAVTAYSTVLAFLAENDFPREVCFVFFTAADTGAFLEAVSGLPGAGEL